MEEFMTEHGSVLVSAIVSIVTLVIIFMVIAAVSQMDAYSMTGIAG